MEIAHGVFLSPGQVYTGQGEMQIRTLLGSCVSVTVWHRMARVGSMCHIMLPARLSRAPIQWDGRYADDAFSLMIHGLMEKGIAGESCEVKVFGGGNMFPHVIHGAESVAGRNIEAVYRLIEQYGWHVCAQDVGGETSRQLVFDLKTGDVLVKHVPIMSHECVKSPHE